MTKSVQGWPGVITTVLVLAGMAACSGDRRESSQEEAEPANTGATAGHATAEGSAEARSEAEGSGEHARSEGESEGERSRSEGEGAIAR